MKIFFLFKIFNLVHDEYLKNEFNNYLITISFNLKKIFIYYLHINYIFILLFLIKYTKTIF